MKPSDRILILISQEHEINPSIEPISNSINAILKYLDEQWEAQNKDKQ